MDRSKNEVMYEVLDVREDEGDFDEDDVMEEDQNDIDFDDPDPDGIEN